MYTPTFDESTFNFSKLKPRDKRVFNVRRITWKLYLLSSNNYFIFNVPFF
jgi:hypothetical protein